jgi:hypothetical protein
MFLQLVTMTKQEKAKDARLRREYHITLEEYNLVLEYQGGACAICKHTHNKEGKRLVLSVDHNHRSGELRGLLCFMCNKIVGVLRDDKLKALNTFIYLNNTSVERVFGEKRFTAPGEIGAKKRKKQLAVFNAARGKGGTEKKRQTGRKSRKV